LPLDVAGIIDEARDRHAAFDNRRNPQKVVRRFLASYAVKLAGKINRIDEQALLTEIVQAMPLANFDAGIALPANRAVAAVVAWDNRNPSRSTPIDLIPWAQRNDVNVPLESAWLWGGKLFLNGEARNWVNIANLAIAYYPDFALVTADTDVIPLRQDARLTLVENAALFMAGRGHTDKDLPPIDMKKFAAAAEDAETEFLKDVSNQLSVTHFRTRDVWSPSMGRF
jgi:hypothetical protein